MDLDYNIGAYIGEGDHNFNIALNDVHQLEMGL